MFFAGFQSTPSFNPSQKSEIQPTGAASAETIGRQLWDGLRLALHWFLRGRHARGSTSGQYQVDCACSMGSRAGRFWFDPHACFYAPTERSATTRATGTLPVRCWQVHAFARTLPERLAARERGVAAHFWVSVHTRRICVLDRVSKTVVVEITILSAEPDGILTYPSSDRWRVVTGPKSQQLGVRIIDPAGKSKRHPVGGSRNERPFAES